MNDIKINLQQNSCFFSSSHFPPVFTPRHCHIFPEFTYCQSNCFTIFPISLFHCIHKLFTDL